LFCNFSKSNYLCTAIAKIAQLVEHDLAPKERTRTDRGKEKWNKVFRLSTNINIAKIAQLVEHDLAPKERTRTDLGKEK